MKKRLRKHRQAHTSEKNIFKLSFKGIYLKSVARPVYLQIKLDEVCIYCIDENIHEPS